MRSFETGTMFVRQGRCCKVRRSWSGSSKPRSTAVLNAFVALVTSKHPAILNTANTAQAPFGQCCTQP
jgi:hypothetical protein